MRHKNWKDAHNWGYGGGRNGSCGARLGDASGRLSTRLRSCVHGRERAGNVLRTGMIISSKILVEKGPTVLVDDTESICIN